MYIMYFHMLALYSVFQIGGATAQIGDPSGRTKERELIDLDTLQNSSNKIRSSLQRIFANYEKLFSHTKSSLGPPTK